MPTKTNTDARVQVGPCVWTPPSPLSGHQGDRLDPKCDFFVVPPREIGAVRSAHSSLKKGKGGKSTPARIAKMGVWFIVGLFFAQMFDSYVHLWAVVAPLTHTPWTFWPVLVAALPAFISWRSTRLTGVCNFVGAEGCAEFVCRGKRENIVDKSVFLFRDAWAISIWMGHSGGSTRDATTPVYFDWYAHPASTEKRVFTLVGHRPADFRTRPADNSYPFARAVECAWYDYLTPRVDEEIAQKGCISFYEGGGIRKRWVRLGRHFIETAYVEVEDKEFNKRLQASEVRTVTVAHGILKIMYKSENEIAKALGETSESLDISYKNIYNGRLFLHAFEKLLEVKVQLLAPSFEKDA